MVSQNKLTTMSDAELIALAREGRALIQEWNSVKHTFNTITQKGVIDIMNDAMIEIEREAIHRGIELEKVG